MSAALCVRKGKLMSSTVLEIEGLTKYYGPRTRPTVRALNQVSFDIKEGEVLAVVGESGSGKSTIAKILNGIEFANEGTVRLGGIPLESLPRQSIQLVFQDPYSALNPLNPVEYVLSRPLVNFGKVPSRQIRGEVERLLEQVKLSPAELFLPKLPHELSGGQRQRVLIARALACRPQVIVADEPVSMLDVSIRAEILGLLNDLRQQASVRAIVYITHDMGSARMIADRMVVLYHGKIVETGRVDNVFLHPAHPYTQLLLRVIPRIDTPWPDLQSEATESPLGAVGKDRGCPFIGRCPMALSICESNDPDLLDLDGPSHKVACHAQF